MSRPRRLIFQIFPIFILVIIVVVGLIVSLSSRSMDALYFKEKLLDLNARANLVAHILQDQSAQDLHGLQKRCRELGKLVETRLTLIDLSGKVLADTDEDPRLMDNHGMRPEIRGAIEGGLNSSRRFSKTLQREMVYLAIRATLQEEIVIVRVSLPMTSLKMTLRQTQWRIVTGGVIITLLAIFLSYYLSFRLTRPIRTMKDSAERFARGQLDHKIPVPDTYEIGSLATSLNSMAVQLHNRITTITHQRNEMEAVFSSMVEGVIAVDEKLTIISLNTAAHDILGLSNEDFQDRDLAEIVDDEVFLNYVREVLTGDPVESREIVLEGERTQYLKLTGSILRRTAGSKTGAVIVVEDVTRTHQLESIRREFVANVSHELKTPITSIKGFVETLLSYPLDDQEQVAHFLDIINRHTDRLNAIINDLLELSRIEQEQDEEQVEIEIHEVKPVLDSVINTFQRAAQQREINLKLEYSHAVRFRMNPQLLEHALNNLLDNAIKYSEQGKTITVSAAISGDQALLAVQDEGLGISEEHQERIFERFYRVDRGRSREMGGTGLGLSIVKHIMQVHRGEIKLESKPGEGSRFELIFPLPTGAALQSSLFETT